MATEKQIQANRKNALKGGVKTAAGKAVSRMNAVSLGLFITDVILAGEDGQKLVDLHKSCVAEFQPVGEMETILVERIVASTWRLKRVLRSEKKYSRPVEELVPSPHFVPGGDYRYSTWLNYSRYESSVERQIYKALHELERLQSARRGKSVLAPPAAEVSTTEDV